MPPVSLAAQAVSQQFASRQPLATAVQALLQRNLSERYPNLVFDLQQIQLAEPQPSRSWQFKPLMSVVQDYLGRGADLDFSERHGLLPYLSQTPPKRLKLPELNQNIDMQVIEGLIRELPALLPIALQDALVDDWNASGPSGVTRWRWLGDWLMNTLRTSGLKQSGLDAASRQTLDQLVSFPERAQRIARHGEQAVIAYSLETVVEHNGQTTRLLSEYLLLTRPINGRAPVLLCAPNGHVECFASMGEFNTAWSQRLDARFVAQTLTTHRYEPQGSIFEHQASLLLNQQLEHLAALKLPLGKDWRSLQNLHTELTEPALYFLDTDQTPYAHLDSLRAHVPEPLRRATPSERYRYRQLSLELASAQQRAGDETYLSGIDDLRTYTVNALQRELRRLAAQAQATLTTLPHPDEVMLTFTVAAGYPGGAGIVERLPISLTDLAIRNLAARPSGQVALTHRLAHTLPAWLTTDAVMGSDGLIERVDIGKHYPLLLKDALLSDSPEALRRERLFSEQQVLQLPLLALELSLKHELGISAEGARMVAALMQPDPSNQHVDQRPVVIRHLALLRSPNAAADKVENMYLIEYQNISPGPLLLYRPLYATSLQQYPSRAALFEAMAQPGALQASVLTWLSDSARPIYDHGGFREPHYLRFGLGSEFAPVRTPPPATLGSDGINDELRQCLVTGRLMQYLFSEHSRALVDQAERESTSNRESRWQVLMEGASLLFGSLLQGLRGPAMLVGWLLTMTASFTQAIQTIVSGDTSAKEQATIDLLLNVAMLLLDFAPAKAWSSLDLTLRQQALSTSLRRRESDAWPVPPAAQVRQGTVGLPGEMARGDNAALDFSFTQARHRLTPNQLSRLQAFKVDAPPKLPAPQSSGPYKGLYTVEDRWYAVVNGDLYRVSLEDDASVVLVDAADSTRRGPYLWVDERGAWTVDTRLRLRGGMPPKRIAAERQRKAQRIEALTAAYQRMQLRQRALIAATDQAQQAMLNLEQLPRPNEVQLANARRHFDATLNEETTEYQQILDSLKEREELRISPPLKDTLALLENTIKNSRKHVIIAEKDRLALYRTYQRFGIEGPALSLAVLRDQAGYQQFLVHLLEINERTIHWLELQERLLEQLFGLGTSGAAVYERLTEGRPNEITALAVKDLQIRGLKRMIVKDFAHPLFNALDSIVSPLQQHVRTHGELNSLELSAGDRLSVLESLMEHYGSALDGLRGLNIVDAEVLDPMYTGKLIGVIEALYQNAAQRLANEVKPIAQPARRPPKRPPVSAGRPVKRVIKTQRKGTFIGQVSSVGSLEVVEVRDEVSNQLLGMYSQRGDEWVEFIEAPPPAPALTTRAVSVVKGEARKLLTMLDDHLRRAEDYRKISRHPQEVEEVLQYEASRYDKLASELDRAIQAQAESARIAADQKLASDLHLASARLSTRGQALRRQLCLELPPNHGNLEYLITQGQVSVTKLGERLQLSGERRDFIQEYAINDNAGYPVWYAHFHYPAATTPKTEYSTAHLKTREQRRQNYYTLLDKAQGTQAVVDIHRGLIGKALAERWFLSFER
ncbi:hypothetical protein GIW54_27295 [Pseudomonas proteolytica]|uniref:Uncharacterized protein n=2 Tax=Pseudomonas proteolytica TaxID=219574 RepID=A0AAW5AG54_9PSED|nr:hypothetical protein [Pseudomonas proteolytica]MCF5060837.1 hypothetical protein [Pseudomonas proteolytica]MCF5104425.1 hypothetical protein [Pseudomonas proteolytica]